MSDRSIIRGYRALESKVGRSRVQLWRDIRQGKFPPPIMLGENSVGWYLDEVEQWLAARPRASYAPAANALAG
jgi:predicted DNA-binding transcriptional regulator AlpA